MQVLARTVCALIALSASSVAHAVDTPITLQAQGGTIRITPIFHGSLQIEYRGKVIHVDPFSQGNYSKTKKADFILITHSHGDHLDQKAIAKLAKPSSVGNNSTIYAPSAVAQILDPGMKTTDMRRRISGSINGFRVMAYNPNSQINMAFNMGAQRPPLLVSLSTLPAYNLRRGPKAGQKFHPKESKFNGYVLTLGGKRIYIAGDTEATPEMKALKNIDIAFIPMNLPYTMTPQEAAAGVRAFKPKMAVPYHYRYPFDKANTNPQQFQAALKGSKTQVVLRDWYRK